MPTKLDALNEGLKAWRELPAGLFRLCMALWELADSKPQRGLYVIGRAKSQTVARYANTTPETVRRGMSQLRSAGLLETRKRTGRFVMYRLRAVAPALQQVYHQRYSRCSASATAIDPVVSTQLSSPSSSSSYLLLQEAP